MNPEVQDVVLECEPEFSTERLKIRYLVANKGHEQVYVLDALPGYDQERRPAPNLDWAYVCHIGGDTAYVLRGVPPLPSDKSVTIRLIPLATRLAPGEKLERTCELSLPLQEASPYYSPMPPEEHDVWVLHRIVFAVQFMPEQGAGLEPAPHGPGFFRVRAKDWPRQLQTLECELVAPGIQLWRRKDWFTRI